MKDYHIGNMTEAEAAANGFDWVFSHEDKWRGQVIRYGDAYTVQPDRVHNPFTGDNVRRDTIITWDSYRLRDINDNLTNEYNNEL
jgi:hypothetical protein